MKQTRALYCLIVGYLHGARLEKTNNYDPVNNGYSFKVPFAPLTFVRSCDLNQPLNHVGQTYFFGFVPQEMLRIAAITRKDLEDALAVEQNRITTTRKKLQSAWEQAAAAVASETQALERAGGVPPLPLPPAASQANSVPPATLPTMTGEETPPAAETPPVASAPHTEGAPPVTGEVGRKVNAFNVYVSSAKAEANGSLSVGYCAFIKNPQTGEVTELGKGGYTREFGKMIVLALRETFESGVIPPSAKTASTLMTVYTSDSYVARMFANNYLRSFANGGWKKKDGKPIANKAEWERVWKHASHMLVKAVLCEKDGADLKECADRAREFAEADHQKRYGLIGPGSSR